jgi:multiple sugar transport system permease protein
MAAIRTGSLIAILSGLCWGFLGMVIIGVVFSLVSGEAAVPPIGRAVIAALVGAAVVLTLPPETSEARRLGYSGVAVLVVLVLLTLGRPFGVSLDAATLLQLVALILFVALVSWANVKVLAGVPIGAMRRYPFEAALMRILKGVGLIFFTVFVFLPFYVMVMTSFKTQAELLANPLDFSINLAQGPANLFASYTDLFRDFRFGTYILNSAIVSISTVLLTLIIAVPGAYAVARLRFPARNLFTQSVLLIYMVPAIVLVLPLYAVFSQLELRNTLTGLLIVYPATTIPVALYMLQGYFRGLPAEMEEAGLMDGLSRAGVIWKITLPLSLPALASVALYVFMIAWNEFLFAFMFLDDPAIFTLPRGVVSLNSSEVPRELMMAGAVVATIPIMIIFLWLERFMVQGLAAGAVKG